MKDGLTQWIEDRSKRGQIARLVVTRGVDLDGQVDTIAPETGEEDETLAARVADCARQDARGFREEETYWVHLFREGAQKAETRRVIDLEARRGEDEDDYTKAGDEHAVTSIAIRGMTDANRTMTQLAKLGIDKSDAEKVRLYARNAHVEDQMFALLDRHAKLMLHEEELKEKREERKERELLFRKLLEQVELLLPIGLSYWMGGGQLGQMSGPAHEFKLLEEFVGTLGPEERDAVIGILDQTQKIALMELAQGHIVDDMKPALVQRVMGAITREQQEAMGGILKTDAQVQAWFKLYAVRKLGFQARAHQLPGASPPNGATHG
jgi:hypothetical protein